VIKIARFLRISYNDGESKGDTVRLPEQFIPMLRGFIEFPGGKRLVKQGSSPPGMEFA